MIPIKLTIEGLYSYQEKQVIDFTSLIEAGLFGIFGKVGSGKSSILEAISFGLYGETERMNSRDNRAYNMMNLKSDRSVIDFEFYNFKDEKYRIYREFRRNSKRFDDVKRGEATLYKDEDGIWVPQKELNIQEVVGLSYENFKRTIIIPQGKFREFIELGGKDRTKMMQEIFGLDRFDLADKTKRLYSSTKESLNLVEGELKSFSQVTTEQIAEQKALHLQETEKFNLLNKTFKEENDSYQKVKAVKDDFEALAIKKVELGTLEVKLPEITAQKNELSQYEQLDKAFSTVLLEQQKTADKAVNREARLATLIKETTELQSQFKKVTDELKVAEQQYAGLEHLKAELYELNLIKEIKKANLAKEALLERFHKGKSFVVDAEKALEGSKLALAQKEIELNTAKTARVDTTMLMAIEAWFGQQSFIHKGIQDVQQHMNALQTELQIVEKDILGLKLKDINHWEQEIEKYRNHFEQEINTIEVELRNHRVAQQLAQYANELHEGQPCPLCGSAHHPHILQGDDVSSAIQQCELRLSDIKDKQERLKKYERKATGLFDKKKLLTTQWQESQQKEQHLQQELVSHQQNFVWTVIEKGNEAQFIELKQRAELANKQVEALEAQFTTVGKEVEQHRGHVDKFTKELNAIEVEGASLESEIKSKSTQIIRLQIETYLSLEETLLVQQVQQREANVTLVEQRYKDLTNQYQMMSPKLASLQTESNSVQVELNELKVAVDQFNEQIKALLVNHQVQSVEEVRSVLDKQINVVERREQIQAFEVQLEVVRNAVSTLEVKLEGISFDQEKFAKQQEVITKLELQVKEATEAVAKLAGEIDRLEKDYAKKQNLQKQYDAIEKRVKNLNTLLTMFSGAGFVNYVSAIYLKNLCDMANTRFHRLTNNQLSLQLNEANEFEIIDYLNNGKARSVKTLSGGQSFQVSLSLALALAESVQSLSKSDRNFFFIDEGFGTQDSESVNIVFETLSNLHKENRIVGIISHVDELQERIPMSLSVVKDEERGSEVVINY
ncbi:AAA family ATPase [Myroides odoratimimus]|uniref:AAA family ATPase n=1 Tax=Myroides odoratimimus TaxID=76832 RepID=UPI0025765F01|nr:SbcC/MukB-like Walker B domain-containing protein [Myroides odoratimimus]MDM1415536.1 AAA family ATPase [Myroides odoratimimus]MDM1447879.1 AAA family ATPase [Myroides odoratimimus]MEC4008993.1 SbcC/MukB-like Walker B domain-containing protein [Myroides odoratimimus]